MDEAKTLIQMALSAIFSAMLLAAAVGLITLGYMFWGYFSREDAANNRLADYANYTAYDNTIVRGQEVVQLIESNDDIFVAVFNGTNNPAAPNMDYLVTENNSPFFLYVPDEVAGAFQPEKIEIDTDNEAMATAMSVLKDKGGTGITIQNLYNIMDTDHQLYETKSHEELVNSFLTANLCGLPLTSEGIDKNSYAAFKSGLIYANDGTTDVVGVVFVKQAHGTEVE